MNLIGFHPASYYSDRFDSTCSLLTYKKTPASRVYSSSSVGAACQLGYPTTAQWSKAIVGGTPKIRHRFAYFLDLQARNL